MAVAKRAASIAFSSRTDLAIAAVEQSWAISKLELFVPLLSTTGSGLQQPEGLMAEVSVAIVSESQGNVLNCPVGGLAKEVALHDEKIAVSLQHIF